MATTVLVVEDELKIRELLRSYFEREGWSVLTTGSGAEALTLAVGGVDLVVLDLGLPDVPGETVATEIRRASATPILMLTARSEEHTSELQSLMRISYAVFCLKKNINI